MVKVNTLALGLLMGSSPNDHDTLFTGYVNKTTGEVIDVLHRQSDVRYAGEDLLRFMENRTRVHNSPGEWVEIPKVLASNINEGIEEFLRANGFEADDSMK